MQQNAAHPALSVIVPVYNAEKYIRQCLSSICEQSFTDIEIICIDDGSTDNSEQIIREFCICDSRILFIKQKNAGPAEARKTGIRLASGTYVGFVDSDDYIDKNFFEYLYSTACSVHADIVVATSILTFSEKDTYSLKNTGYSKRKTNLSLEEKCNLFLHTGIIWNKIYKRSLLKNIKDYYISSKSPVEDNSFTIVAVATAKSVAVIPEAKYFYRQNKNSICHTPVSLQLCIDSYHLYECILSYLQYMIPPSDRKTCIHFAELRRNRDCFQLAERLSGLHDRIKFLIYTKNIRFICVYMVKKIFLSLKKVLYNPKLPL